MFCALALFFAPALWAKGTPAGTQIRNTAQVSYETSNALRYTVYSDTLVVVVGQVAGVDLEPPRYSLSDPGITVVFTHTLVNVGNGADSFVLTAGSTTSWPLRLYLDVNRDGLLDAGDTEISGPIPLAADDTANVLVAVDVPGSAAVRGIIDTVDVQAASTFDGSMTDALQDVIEIRDVGIVLSLTKSVDRVSATIGDVLTYTLDYSASGAGSATGLALSDPIPLGAAYVPGTLRLNGASLTDASGDDAGRFEAAGNRVVFPIGDIAGGENGSASFQVRVESGAMQTGFVTNLAAASYQTIAGTDSVGSDTARTTLVYPEFSLEKTLLSPTVAQIGDDVRYTLRYGNWSSAAIARDVVVSDTLPGGLEFVSSQPAAAVSDSILTWTLGDLAPGDTATIDLTVRVSDLVRDTLVAINQAILTASNALADEVAAADAVRLVGLTSSQLSLDKTADVIEVGLGETVPYTLTLENTGLAPLSDLRIYDRLPEGARFSQGSMLGADSIQAKGRDLTIFVAGPLGPGAIHTVRYAAAIVSARERTLANTAYATAEGDLVRSTDIVAWVSVRSSWPMETRSAIGKVWVDLNDDGIQQAGEPGVAGVDIWTDDGEVVASDGDGKFSLRNLRPGRHAFRLDPTTLPLAYRLPGDDLANDMVTLDADGWTTPRVNFRLIPRVATLRQVILPVSWTFSARPLRLEREIVCQELERLVILEGFDSNSARPPIDSAFVARIADALAQWPDCWLEIAGHSDALPIRRGPYRDNWHLSEARAESVAHRLIDMGLNSRRVLIRGYGSSELVAPGDDLESHRLNRRVELKLIMPRDTLSRRPLAAESLVELEVAVRNDYDVALNGLSLSFQHAVDSVAIATDSMLTSLAGLPTELPPIAPGSSMTIKAWTRCEDDSAAAVLHGPANDAGSRLLAAIHNPLMPVNGVSEALVIADSLPNPAALPAGATVTVTLAPALAGWPEAAFKLPAAWLPVEGSAKLGGAAATDPEIRYDHSRKPWLFWRLDGRVPGAVSLQLRPTAAAGVAETVGVPALRSDEERAAEKKRAFIAGPGVEIFEPRDGSVLGSDRVYVGVRGEPVAPVALFDGDSLIAQANLRIDGVHDFIAIPLDRGPHRLRVRMKNSWGQERWDSLAIHVSGRPAQIATETQRLTLRADGQTTATLHAQVQDRWGVPVVNPTSITVAAEGAVPLGDDVDPSSIGTQLRTDEAGWLRVDLRPGHEVGRGMLVLSADDVRHEIELENLPALRPLMVTGVGRFGLGAAPDAFGALTARGRLDERTSVTLSLDSRRLDAGRDFFGRSYDPLEQSQYPLLGDVSRTRTLSSSDYFLSARIERGFDWLALGDISTADFGGGLNLTRYQRALSGAAARLSTGPVVWNAFGSSTRQSLQQLQIRGAGVSGPYELQPNIRPGTDQVVIETRARENAQRIISQQALARYVDYQIDYERGTLLFKRPVPAADTYQNPVFIVVTFEATSGGDREAVVGLRAATDAAALFNVSKVDSLRVGATFIHDGASGGNRQLAGADVRLISHGGFELGAELSYAGSSDSSGFATAVEGAVKLMDGDLELSAGWTRIGDEYHNPSNLALRGGIEEIKAAGALKVGAGALRVAHERQSFGPENVRRERTSGGITQPLGSQFQVDAGLAADRFVSPGSSDASQAGELKLTWTPDPDLSLWTETRQGFAGSGNAAIPNYIGGGAAYQVATGFKVETQHRHVQMPGDSSSYSVTSLGLRTALGFGTEAYGSYQLAGGAGGGHNAALVGLNNRLRLGQAWSLNGLFERRVGLGDASIADPVRALPFLRNEEDYWSFGLGAEFLPPELPYRASARGEFRNGDFRSNRLFTLAGDMAINRSLAVLSRSEYLWSEQPIAGGDQVSERISTLWGLAFRPIGSDALNVLTKFEWLDETNPIGGGVLATDGQEQRLIGVAEAIWAPTAFSELAARYALRRSEAERPLGDGVRQTLTSWADYFGTRLNLEVRRWLAFRGETRLLVEHTSDARRWDMAPSLVFMPLDAFEVQVGYRFGDLHDPDFAVRGGHGLFVVFGARITEQVYPTAADYWRPRFGQK